jgi:peptidylprolyl isomerase
VATLAVVALGVAACGGGDDDTASTTSSSSTPSTVASTADGLPLVSGVFGKTPTVTVPTTTAPTALKTKVLTKGKGATVASGDMLVADYEGQTWRPAAPFDSSFKRGQAAAFSIGTGKVIKGWDEALVGQTVGSRVLLVIPPDLGYGSSGQTDAGIKGTDTLVFVVDILDTVKADASATGTATGKTTPGIPDVVSVSGQKPSMTVAAGTAPPTASLSEVLLAGTGSEIKSDSSLIVQIYQVDYTTGAVVYDSWTTAPQTATTSSLPTEMAAALTGQKVGARVAYALPAGVGADNATGVIIDVLYSIGA